MERKTLIRSKLLEQNDGFLLIYDRADAQTIQPQAKFSIRRVDDIKHCTGWYDLFTHTNHACPDDAIVERQQDTCFACRQRTGFNPAFYNTTILSEKQRIYNEQSNTVYIAYFGDGIVKAGMLADSRGLERLYEQGALLYTLLGSYKNATVAHNLEARLIKSGLRDSVRKQQKAAVLQKPFGLGRETQLFQDKLVELGYSNHQIVSNLDRFFFGSYSSQNIKEFPLGEEVSGEVCGLVGGYLILRNNERFYGVWLDHYRGYQVAIGENITELRREPEQVSLFS